jgi:hypothetical protein
MLDWETRLPSPLSFPFIFPGRLRLRCVLMMRILCLHGYGTSGAIMRNQLDAFIRHADASYEFVFLDGEYGCPKAQGMDTRSHPSHFPIREC